jgi:hypothetical protein
MRLNWITLLAAGLAMASPAAAQDVEDWDIDRDPDHRRITASVFFSDGSGVATRCSDRSFAVLLVGLPQAPDDGDFMRPLSIDMGHGRHTQSWLRGETPTLAFSLMPARLARQLRDGGRIQIYDATNGSDAPLIAIDLPPSPEAINATLEACGLPTDDPRDDGRDWVVTPSPQPLRWRFAPQSTAPDRALSGRLLRGIVVMSCVAQADGRIRDCQVEMEHPTGFDLGREALRATRDARVETSDGSEIAPRIITFRINYVRQN